MWNSEAVCNACNCSREKCISYIHACGTPYVHGVCKVTQGRAGFISNHFRQTRLHSLDVTCLIRCYMLHACIKRSFLLWELPVLPYKPCCIHADNLYCMHNYRCLHVLVTWYTHTHTHTHRYIQVGIWNGAIKKKESLEQLGMPNTKTIWAILKTGEAESWCSLTAFAAPHHLANHTWCAKICTIHTFRSLLVGWEV